jgi:hypothetical protein
VIGLASQGQSQRRHGHDSVDAAPIVSRDQSGSDAAYDGSFVEHSSMPLIDVGTAGDGRDACPTDGTK